MITPSSKYPGQVAIDLTNYPQGKARNVSGVGSGDGTPLERDWLNDWFGFQQASVLAAGITPSGSPDTALISQVLQALQALMLRANIGSYQITDGVTPGAGSPFPLTLIYQLGGYVLASNVVTVPAPGKYRVAVGAKLAATSAANPSAIIANIAINGSSTGFGLAMNRYSATPAEYFSLMAETVLDITTPATQGISLQSLAGGVQIPSAKTGTLIIQRVG